MSDAAEKKPGSGRTLFLLAFLAIVVLAGVTAWLYRRAEKARDGWERSCQEYDKMKTMKKTIVDLRQKSGGGTKKIQPPPDNPGDLQAFFGQKRREQQIGDMGVREPDRAVSMQGWKEYAYQLSLRKEAAVSRAALVNFLISIERERPYLKSKELTINYEENGTVWGNMTISFFKADAK